ncbi:amidohydrolase 2 [Epithele typhae]|uniref:amidohydrolase 2 n=1 Tax=Epithele typhae TaxID=378194 RepID=UPI00200803E5|nr:amidohydrolase 2 [Epithele typhae]KAH9927170.1 amidohydrolase 2 [Epithele typhae]
MAAGKLLIDVHTHVYLPRYAAFLRSRTDVPRIFTRTSPEGQPEERLLILDDEPPTGRPVGAQYWDRDEKLKFMDLHSIDMSVVSSANPWLDFLPASTAHKLAEELNVDLEDFCATGPTLSPTLKRLYGFGLLPLVPGASTAELVSTVEQIARLPHLKGLIMGTKGVGKGLDDDALEPVWAAIEQAGLIVFLHPHYGVDKNAWGEKENGHVLPLALGFPFETTIATTRLILAGVLDRYPSLKLLLAHSGGALPQLSSRLASCVTHDPLVASRLQHDARFYLGRLHFDAVAYGAEELGFVADAAGRAHAYASTAASATASVGAAGAGKRWKSVVENLEAIEGVDGWGEGEKDAVRGGNALRLLGLGA